MTMVIGSRTTPVYAPPMHPSTPGDLSELLQTQRALEDELRLLPPGVDSALAAGHAVLAFAARETEAFSLLQSLLDPAAHQDLARQHAEIAEDLTLLEWLLTSGEDERDVDVLSRSLVRRMREHVERDGRLLVRALRLSQK